MYYVLYFINVIRPNNMNTKTFVSYLCLAVTSYQKPRLSLFDKSMIP